MPNSSETKIQLAVLKEQAAMNTTEHQEIKQVVKDGLARIESKLDKKADLDVVAQKADKDALKAVKDESDYWRNILVSGILLSVFLGVIGILVSLFVKK